MCRCNCQEYTGEDGLKIGVKMDKISLIEDGWLKTGQSTSTRLCQQLAAAVQDSGLGLTNLTQLLL